MKPSFSPQWVFYGKISILWMLFSLNACVKDDITNISDNITMEQSFAIPLGAKEIRLSKPPISDTSSAGPYIYTYDNLPFSTNSQYINGSETVSFNLSSNPNSNWIKKITFNIKIENSFIKHTNLQIYLIRSDSYVLDKFFSDNGFTTSIYYPDTVSITYEGARLELLKQANFLQYELKVSTNGALAITEETKLRVTVGATAELEYNVKELKN